MAYNRYTSPRYQSNYGGSLNRELAAQLARNPRERVNLGALRPREESVPTETPYIPNSQLASLARPPIDYGNIRSPIVGGIMAGADILSAKLERDRFEEAAAEAARRRTIDAGNKLDAMRIMEDKDLTTQDFERQLMGNTRGLPAQTAFDPPPMVIDPETGERTQQNRGLAEILSTPARPAFNSLDADQRFLMARQLMGDTAALENRDELYAAGTPPQPTYKNYPPGHSIYTTDPETGKLTLVTTAPPESDVLTEKALAQRLAMRRAGVEQPLTYQQEWDKLDLPENWGIKNEIYKAGRNAAAQTQNQIEPLMLALNDEKLYTGLGAESVLTLKKAAQFFGVEVEGVASGELAKTITAKMALDMKTDLPGPMSDSDRQFLVNLPPGLANSQDGNALIAQYYKRRNDRLIKYAEMTRDYEDKNGFVDGKHYDAMAAWSAANPIFTQDDYDARANVMSPTTSNTPDAGLPGLGVEPVTDLPALPNALSGQTLRNAADAVVYEGSN